MAYLIAASCVLIAGIAMVERILGNTSISQYLASQARLTVMEELQAMRAAA